MVRSLIEYDSEAQKVLEELKDIIGGIAPSDQETINRSIEYTIEAVFEILDRGGPRSFLKQFLEEGLLAAFETIYCAGGQRGIWKDVNSKAGETRLKGDPDQESELLELKKSIGGIRLADQEGINASIKMIIESAREVLDNDMPKDDFLDGIEKILGVMFETAYCLGAQMQKARKTS